MHNESILHASPPWTTGATEHRSYAAARSAVPLSDLLDALCRWRNSNE